MGRLYAEIATETGWTTEEIDETPWFRILDLLDYWIDFPPVHRILRAVLLGDPKRRDDEMSPEVKARALELLTKAG